MVKKPRPTSSTGPTSGLDGYDLVSRIHAQLSACAADAQRLEAALKRGVELESVLESLRGLSGAAKPLAGITDELEALAKSWKSRADHEFLVLEDRLRRECQARGWRLDGQWPAFYVERAISVVVEEKQRTVSVSEEKLRQPTIETIIGRLESMIGDLLPRAFSARTFMTSLARAYDRIRAGSAQIPLLSVYRQLVCDQQKPKFWRNARTDAFVGMSIEQFRARLTSALEQGVTAATDRRELRMFPPIDPNEAVFLYQPAEARFGFVGRIEFLIANRGEGEDRS
jgi:hypothetical protein